MKENLDSKCFNMFVIKSIKDNVNMKLDIRSLWKDKGEYYSNYKL